MSRDVVAPQEALWKALTTAVLIGWSFVFGKSSQRTECLSSNPGSHSHCNVCVPLFPSLCGGGM